MNFLRNIKSKLKTFVQHQHDLGYNRKCMGTDRNGNKYYQYYTKEGEEDKREVEVFSSTGMNGEYDPYWDEWLRYKQRKPFTHEELEVVDC